MARSSTTLATLITACAALSACDPVVVPPPTTATQTTAPNPVPTPIAPSVWGDATPTSQYEVRALPDGSPGLFTADGALLAELLPELIVDAAVDGKRLVPTERRFDLVKLAPGDDGGFTLFARLTDDLATHDLRIENGKHDPRVHVGVVSKWAKPALVNRVIVRFRTGAVGPARALGHDYSWTTVADEWVGPGHAPHIVAFGDDKFTVEGRHGTEGLVVRRAAERWVFDLEVLHHENHPIEAGDDCGATLDGARPVAPAERTEARADLVLGAARLPLVGRYRAGAKAAVALVSDGGRSVLPPTETAPPVTLSVSDLWFERDFQTLPCAKGRFRALAGAGKQVAWSGVSLPIEAENVLAPTEADARRVIAFRQPGIPLEALFAIGDAPATAEWFQAERLAALQAAHGAIVAVTPGSVDDFLAADVSATRTVRDELGAAGRSGAVWVAPVGDLARHLAALGDVDLDFLPAGVVRVRNLGPVDVTGLTLIWPDQTTARFDPDAPVQNGEGRAWFDLPAGKDLLLQIVGDGGPAPTMQPARVTVALPAGEPAAGQSSD